MPGDGFAFPVGVGCQVDGIGALGGLGELLDGVLLVLWDFVERCEVFGNVDAEPVLGEVTDVAQEAITLKSLPSIFSMVRALAGDSTITSFLAIRVTLGQDRQVSLLGF